MLCCVRKTVNELLFVTFSWFFCFFHFLCVSIDCYCYTAKFYSFFSVFHLGKIYQTDAQGICFTCNVCNSDSRLKSTMCLTSLSLYLSLSLSLSLSVIYVLSTNICWIFFSICRSQFRFLVAYCRWLYDIQIWKITIFICITLFLRTKKNIRIFFFSLWNKITKLDSGQRGALNVMKNVLLLRIFNKFEKSAQWNMKKLIGF